MNDTREKLVDLIERAKRSMWGKNGLLCELARNLFMADYLLANGVTVQKWIPVTERLPDAYVSVLVQMPGEEPFPTVTAGFISNDGIWFGGLYHREPGEVTHWMPMPEPPEEERQKNKEKAR